MCYNASSGPSQDSRGQYIRHPLGATSNNGEWHTYVRNMRDDLQALQFDNEILETNTWLNRSDMTVDNIRLYSTSYDGL